MRRVQIEKQALRLAPSMSHHLLSHMPSFQRALQVVSPLNAAQWDLLFPALVAEREEATAKAKAAHKLRLAGQPLDILIKKKLKDYFFDYWRLHWRNTNVVRETSRGQFAAGALSHVRMAFFKEYESDTAHKNNFERPFDPLIKPFLPLRYSSWFFEQVLSQHLGGSSSFFCCPKCPMRKRKLTLMGLLNHHSSKHSMKFRSANNIPDMTSEWPKDFVFCPEVSGCTEINQAQSHTLKVTSQFETLKIGPDTENKTNSVVSPKPSLIETICFTATTIWSILPASTLNFVKAQILIDQLVRRYSEGSRALTFDLFREVLQADCMAKIRPCNVIRCIVCHISSEKLKRQPLTDVVEHFYDKHYGQQNLLQNQWDWRKDMIFVPPERVREAWAKKSKKLPPLVRLMYLQAFPDLPNGQPLPPKPTAAPPEAKAVKRLKAIKIANPAFEGLGRLFSASSTLDTPASLPVLQPCPSFAADSLALNPPAEMDRPGAAISKPEPTYVETNAVVPMKRVLENIEDSPASKRLKKRKSKRAAKAARKGQTGGLDVTEMVTAREGSTDAPESKKRPLEDAEENWLSSKRPRQEPLPQSAPRPDIKMYDYSALQRDASQICAAPPDFLSFVNMSPQPLFNLQQPVALYPSTGHTYVWSPVSSPQGVPYAAK